MGLISNIFNKKNNSTQAETNTTQTIQPKIDLTKKKEEVHTICLSKQPLNGLKARVGLVLDYSGSMDHLYYDGTVQKVIENALPLAMEFDDNGSMEVWIFHNGCHRLPDITLDNCSGYVNREILGKYNMGGTNYAPVMNDVTKTYKDSNVPCYVMFITDGDNSDKAEAINITKESSKFPVFWQFIGIGRARFSFLEKLDDLTGRYVDNADFFEVNNALGITYKQLLNEFPDWLQNERVKAMLHE